MGVIKQGILGGFSGSVANVVGSSWKGIAVIKSKPLSVANPRTVLQVGNRVKFKAGSELASSCLIRIVKPLWDRDAQRMSGFNAWVQENHDAFDSLGVFQPDVLNISKGHHAVSVITSVAVSTPQKEVTVKWDAINLVGEQLATDDVYVLVKREAQDEIAISHYGVKRSDGEVVLPFEEAFGFGEGFYCYLAFRSEDGFRLFAQDKDITATA